MSGTIHFETLGCKLNQIESESVARAFLSAGHSVDMTPVTARTPPDGGTALCIINTCTVTTKAEQKARRIIRLLLEKYPSALVLVTGCFAEVEPEQIRAIDGRVAVLAGTKKNILAQFPSTISCPFGGFTARSLEAHLKALLETDTRKEAEALKNSSFALCTDTFMQHSRASLKIQDGCNNSCTYCRIHIARGPAVSLPVSEALSRVSQLEKAGQKEVVLTGVNLSQYAGSTEGILQTDSGLQLRALLRNGSLRPFVDFPKLLQFLLDNTSSISFRISSLYPDRVDDEMLEVIRDERIRPHFHLSVQSGSDLVLKAMKRPYKAEDVIRAAHGLRQVKPGCFLAADVIVGFPSETDSDFDQSADMCRQCGFSWVHVFPFSARPGTEAWSMRPQVPQSVSGKRARLLTEQAETQKEAYLKGCIGREYRAIIEKRRVGELRAVTENFLHVRIASRPAQDAVPVSSIRDMQELGGKEVTVRITSIVNARAQTEAVEVEGIITKI